eukprot:245093-Pyramimonas_sp.AAC.1
MQQWLDKGCWTEHRSRRWHSLRKVDRDEKGKSICSKRTGAVITQENFTQRDLKRAIIEERKLHRGVVCTCFGRADHWLGCPMRRPSWSPDFRGTPWVWSRGDGRGYCADPNAAPCSEQLTECDYEQATAPEIFNRDYNVGEPASPKPEDDDQQGDDEAEDMAEVVDPTEAALAGYASDYSDALSTVAD